MISYIGRNSGRFVNRDLPWLVTSQRDYELSQLIKIYEALKPMRVLEIGTQEGGTLYQWIKYAPAGATIVNVDILQDQTDGSALIDRWHSWRTDEIELITIFEYSHKAEGRVRAELPEIDFLFIDGDHSYEGAKLDFDIYGPMVRPGGVIVFHDLMTPKSGMQNHIQVGRLWREIQHAGYLTREIWSEQDPEWGGIGVVYVQAQAHIPADEQRERQRRVEAFQPMWEPGYLPNMRKEEDTGGTP